LDAAIIRLRRSRDNRTGKLGPPKQNPADALLRSAPEQLQSF